MDNGAYEHTHAGHPLPVRCVERVEMQGPYGEVLRAENKEMNCWKTKKGAKSVILSCDAQVEFQPSQEPLTGSGQCGDIAKNTEHNNLEMQLEAGFFKLLQQQGLKLINTTGGSRLLGTLKTRIK